jgi:[ribosomal protein S5]-alanine N-acetyltransferase
MLDPRVGETLWPAPTTPPAEADLRASLEAKLEHWERHGFGSWLMRDRASGETVGRGGLQYCDVLDERAVEVGWAVRPEWWGRGFATELAQTSVEVAFEVIGLPELIAFTLPDNAASRRVIEKAGFRYVGEIEHAELPHVLYARRGRC